MSIVNGNKLIFAEIRHIEVITASTKNLCSAL
jgi:hypothetical protein